MGIAFSTHGARSDTTKIHFGAKPAVVNVKKRKQDSDVTEICEIALSELVETKCSSLFTPFQPSSWLFNGHLQTLYSVSGNFTKVDSITYRRKYLRLLDGGTLGLDFTPSNFAEGAEDVPMIVVAHGLTGGSHESYVRAILAPACGSIENGGLGYRGVVVNFRGCAEVPITSPRLYNAGDTDDLRQALAYISATYPKAPLLGVSFSMGANVMTRYVAQEGINSRLSSVCAISCPWDLEKNGFGVLESFLGKYLYSRGMGINLVNLLKRHEQSFNKYPDHPISQVLPTVLSLKYPTFPEFDEQFTRRAGGDPPHFPHATVGDYYRWASSHNVLGDIRIPFLAINAEDDPVVKSIPREDLNNGWVTLVCTDGGGHLGWFQSVEESKIERWTTKAMLEWFRMCIEDIDHGCIPRGRSTLVNAEGFIQEEGREDLGCKEIDL